MSNEVNASDFSRLGLEVPISAIEKELRKMWEQNEAQTNASLMNLVIYSEKQGSLAENSDFIECLTRDHACRAILVEIDRSVPEAGLRSWITAHCHLANGRKSVCCEQVAFHLTGRVTGRFRNTVFSHLNSDLPLVFWWQGELSDVFTERLVSVMNRLIVDSSGWVDPAESFRKIDDASRANPKLVIQDLAWTRTWQFRVGVAGLFDEPVALRVLPEIEELRVVCHPAHRNSALQMISWVSVQAEWKWAGEAGELAFISKGGKPVAVVLEEDGSSAALGKLELRSSDTSIRLSRENGSAYVFRQVESVGYSASSLSPADPEVAAELVALQLSRGGKNSLYRKILPRFREMLSSTDEAANSIAIGGEAR